MAALTFSSLNCQNQEGIKPGMEQEQNRINFVAIIRCVKTVTIRCSLNFVSFKLLYVHMWQVVTYLVAILYQDSC